MEAERDFGADRPERPERTNWRNLPTEAQAPYLKHGPADCSVQCGLKEGRDRPGAPFHFIGPKISRGERGTREGQRPFFFSEAQRCA